MGQVCNLPPEKSASYKLAPPDAGHRTSFPAFWAGPSHRDRAHDFAAVRFRGVRAEKPLAPERANHCAAARGSPPVQLSRLRNLPRADGRIGMAKRAAPPAL